MKKFWPAILVLVLIIPAMYALFGSGYFNMHDDLQAMRVFEMEKCFADGQIPCRWAPDMAWGYGQAMFNYYSAFPYILGVLIRILTPLSILGTVKLLFILSLVGGTLGMYLLGRELWGKWGGVLAAVLYSFAPYHAVDVYIRGAMAEAFSLAILPFLWWSFYLLIKKPTFGRVAGVALAVFALLTTHNISTMIYAPFTALWIVFLLIKFKGWKSLGILALSGILGVGLAAFFIVPATFEQSLIQTRNLISEYSDYHGHFVTLNQLFLSRFWGDGPSVFGTGDGMSFQIGWPHWWIGIMVSPLIFLWARQRKYLQKAAMLAFLLILFLASSFLTHSRSIFIWERLPPMAFVQFPWRFLGPSMFFLALAGGAIASYEIRFKKVLVGGAVFLAIALNAGYFVPVHFSSKVTDGQKLSGLAFELQQKAAILDYLPKTAKLDPPSLAFGAPKVVLGNGEFFGFSKSSNRFSFEAQIYGGALVEIPVIYFPNWIVLVDGREVPIKTHETYGFIMIDLGDGKHDIRGRLTNTPIRDVANGASLISLLGLFAGLVIWEKKRNTE